MVLVSMTPSMVLRHEVDSSMIGVMVGREQGVQAKKQAAKEC